MTVSTLSSGSDMCNLRYQQVGCADLHSMYQPPHGALLDQTTTKACLVSSEDLCIEISCGAIERGSCKVSPE